MRRHDIGLRSLETVNLCVNATIGQQLVAEALDAHQRGPLSLSRARALCVCVCVCVCMCVCVCVALLLPLILVCVLAAGEAHFPELRHVFIQPGAGDAALTSFCESKGLHVHNGCVLVELTAANSSAW